MNVTKVKWWKLVCFRSGLVYGQSRPRLRATSLSRGEIRRFFLHNARLRQCPQFVVIFARSGCKIFQQRLHFRGRKLEKHTHPKGIAKLERLSNRERSSFGGLECPRDCQTEKSSVLAESLDIVQWLLWQPQYRIANDKDNVVSQFSRKKMARATFFRPKSATKIGTLFNARATGYVL